MPENTLFPPEGLRPPAPCSLAALKAALDTGAILESPALRCDARHSLRFSLGGVEGVMSRPEALAPWISGSDRDIAVLSQVGKPTCFTVEALRSDEKGAPVALLSRRKAQEQALSYFLAHLSPGAVLAARVTHTAPFGAFLDIGCGVIAMLPIEMISVSRISHPRERFSVGQKILAVLRSVDREKRRFTMTHRELLGTWMENASWFSPGETVRGIVRSVRDYGAFVELTPNLSGLADLREDLHPGDPVSVYIRSIRPENMKIKLQIIDRLPPETAPAPLRYQITDGVLDRWVYSPPGCSKPPVETVFKEALP